MICDALYDVGKIGLWVDTVEFCSLDNGVEDSGTCSAGIGVYAGPVSAPEGQRTDGALGSIIGHFKTAIESIARQGFPPF